jgi:hypothetical protein
MKTIEILAEVLRRSIQAHAMDTVYAFWALMMVVFIWGIYRMGGR